MDWLPSCHAHDLMSDSAQIDAAMRLLESMTETYAIDTGCIYTTSESMGGMTSFHLIIAYPDFFAVYLFVGSQWDVKLLDGLEQENLFCIVSAGDPKASVGQAELLALFDADRASYTHAERKKEVEQLFAEYNADYKKSVIKSVKTQNQSTIHSKVK